jgi:hypothetical protein
MRRRGWWWVAILMMAGALGGCGDGDHDDGHREGNGCALFGELEPNDTVLTADFLGAAFVGDCVDVVGTIGAPADVDTYRFFVQERLTLFVTLDHRAGVDFDMQFLDTDTQQLLLDCGSPLVPEGCVVPLTMRGRDLAVDVVVTAVIGAGPYTLTLEAQ